MKKIFTLFSGLVLISFLFGLNYANAQKHPYAHNIVDTIITEDGKMLIGIKVPGKPPKDYKAPIAFPTDASTILPSIPAYDWSFGCSATSAAMIAGHYDNMGYPNMYAGPTNGGVMPMDNSAWPDVFLGGEWRHQCPLSATRDGVDGRTTLGHVDDYWVSYGSTAPDPYIGNWTQHTHGECTGDYMKTNQSAFGNDDASTTFYYWNNGSAFTPTNAEDESVDHLDGMYGFKLFCESRGYTVTSAYSQYIEEEGLASGFTYDQFKTEIDAGRPVLIHVTDHTMVGYGYDDATNLVYIHDTWDYSDHTMTWAGSYGGLLHYGVTVLRLSSSTINVWTGNDNHYWSNSGNWSLGHIPLSTEDVEIPNVNMPCYVDVYAANCNDLIIYPGATLEIRDEVLTVNNDLTVHGTIEMSQASGILNVMHDIVWESGSFLDVLDNSTYIQVWGDWNFNSGANVNPTQGFVDFEGTASHFIRCYDDNCSFYRLRLYKSGGAITYYSNLSSEDLVVTSLIYINSTSTFNSLSTNDIIIRGALNYYGPFNFNVTGSTVYFDGTSQTMNKYDVNDGVFNNVVFSASTGMTIANGGLTAMGNITIDEGFFNPGVDPVSVGGNWTNYMGPSGFEEGTGRVIFNGGNYHQYCSNETFNELEIDKPLGGAFRMDGTNVVCAAYDWTAGAVDVLSGSFTANDLLDNAIQGGYYLNAGGTINLTNSGTGQYVDLKGDVHIFGGTMNVSGSVSEWPYQEDASIEMSGGVLDFTNCGIYITNNAYTLSDNITGGTIRTAYGFSGNRADFTPTAGIFEFYGTQEATLSQTNGCTINAVVIDKGSKDSMPYQPYNSLSKADRVDVTMGNGSKFNNISLSSNFEVTNYLRVSSGSLTLNGHELTIPNHCYVYGILNMDDPADILNVGTTYAHRLWFYSGSTGNLNEGVANIYGWFQPEAGCSVTGSLNHTVIFKGVEGGGPNNFEPTTTYGNIEIFKDPGQRTYISAMATQPIVVNGDFTVHPNNQFELQDKTMIVHGLFTDNSTSEIYTYTPAKDGSNNAPKDKIQIQDHFGSKSPNIVEVPIDATGAKGGYLEIDTDFTLNGLLDVGDGEVYVHGHYDQESTATLSITSGSFICDGPTTSLCSVYGNLSLSTGLFEITNNHLRLNALCSISGGTIRSGGTFWASFDGYFQPTAGVVELLGTGGTGQYISVHANNYFHDLTINRTNSIFIYTGFDLNIKNNFTILSGGLNTNNRDIYIGGTWDNTVGTDAFLEGTGKVVFNKSSGGVQFINSDENFNILENNTSDQFRISSSQDTVTCNSYNRISGGIGVFNGTFIAYDLAQGGIYGNIYALPNSNIYLYQDAGQYVDMFSDWIYVSGGTLNIIGGQDESYWCGGSTALDLDIIDGGVLNFDGPGISIYDTQLLDYNIDNGTLRTSGWFACYRTDFNPTSGLTEFYGENDALISVQSGSSLYDVLINKSGGVKTSYTFKDRDGTMQTGSKSNKAYLGVNLDVMGNLDIDAGTLELTGQTLNCYGNTMVNNGGILQLLDNSTFALDNLSDFHVNNGGWLLSIGSAGNPVTLTHITGYYDLWIQDGGYISAEHTIFEYMSTSGVYLRPGSTANAVNAFNNCAFQYGQTGGYLLVLYNDQAFTASNVVFPTNTWGSGYNVYKSTGSNAVSFYNASGGFAGPTYELDPGDDVHWTATSYEVDLEVFLEGPFNDVSTKMDMDLNNMGVIPTSQPFDSNPLADWYYTGVESVGSIPAFVIDWLLVELRDAPNVTSALPGRVIARQAAFVLNNGEVVGMDGLNPLDFDAAVFDNLYVNIWHRNHLGVISANPLTNVGGTYSYNFHSGSGQAYGGTSAQVELSPGMWGILSGDANGSGNITTHDNDIYWDAQAGESGYKVSDFDLDGQVNNQDKNDYWLPNWGADSYIPE